MLGIFKKLRKPKRLAKTWKTGGGWGDAIDWMSTEKDKRGFWRVVGWKTPKPKAGDLLETSMQSGRTGIFRFISIEECGNPQDMFFVDVLPIGYKKEALAESEDKE